MIWLIPLLAQSLPEACQNLRAERNRFALKACECSKLATHLQRQRCFADEAARLPAATSFAKRVNHYFYDAPPGVRFRAPSCINRRRRNSQRCANGIMAGAGAEVFDHNISASGDCFWGNMAYSKSILIILLCRALGVSHIIESGRMGGMSLMHYHHFGFQLTSVEMCPIRYISEALARAIPGLTLVDGNGMTAVPAALHKLHTVSSDRGSTPRVAVILDGPKMEMARQLAADIRNSTVLIVLDDQIDDDPLNLWPHATMHSGDPAWRAVYSLAADKAALTRNAEFEQDARFYFEPLERAVATTKKYMAGFFLGDRAFDPW